jgi:hypothetical protein
MMSWLSSLLGAGDVVEKTMGGLDSLFTSDDERNQAKIIIEKQYQEFAGALESQMTERWKADMASDSWLSKNIRPGTWAAMTILLIGVVIASFVWEVDSDAMGLVKYGWMTITGLYVPAREVGKGILNWKKK